MIILIAGDTHTGKTLLAQKLLERLGFPYFSIDHLKIGLIRAGQTALTAESDDNALTDYLWPVVREIIKTNIENGQNLIVEGCYIPFGFADSFEPEYLREIRYVCLAFTDHYIDACFDDILANKSVIEKRVSSGYITSSRMKEANSVNVEMCRRYGLNCLLVDDEYNIDRLMGSVVEAVQKLGG
ncbi:MAG: AAA family ATPase [Oscillospiraceae bacterium]|jgi:2-phosphoglycerate kinase|nr:AAA family ATPase [Oscillospiraceae bacterium]